MVEKSKMKLHPFNEVHREFVRVMATGAACHQQFNCSSCGVKQTMGEPNIFYATGKCEECGQITDIRRDGCNYLAHFKLGQDY